MDTTGHAHVQVYSVFDTAPKELSARIEGI